MIRLLDFIHHPSFLTHNVSEIRSIFFSNLGPSSTKDFRFWHFEGNEVSCWKVVCLENWDNGQNLSDVLHYSQNNSNFV